VTGDLRTVLRNLGGEWAGALPARQRRELLDEAARTHDDSQAGGQEIASSFYDADGGEHLVVIDRHPSVGWRVVDVAPDGGATLVERVAGFDDTRSQARALAVDYARQWREHVVGERPDPPRRRSLPMAAVYRLELRRP
jgi:hypothetical protein